MDANLPIGLNPDDSASLCKELNALLCDLHVFYQNVRGFHWNVQGQNFFELHAKFEEFYTDLQVKIDEVAERVGVEHASVGRADDACHRSCGARTQRVVGGGQARPEGLQDRAQLRAARRGGDDAASLGDGLREPRLARVDALDCKSLHRPRSASFFHH